jgi:hypothetical protein
LMGKVDGHGDGGGWSLCYNPAVLGYAEVETSVNPS